MKPIYKNVIFLAILIFSTCQPPAPPVGGEARGSLTPIRMTVIYSEPNTNSHQIATVNEGTELILLYQQAEWYKVRLPNHQEGWIHSTVVRKTTYGLGAVLMEDVQLRPRPRENAPVLQILPAGTKVLVLQEQADWIMLQKENSKTMGWATQREYRKASRSTTSTSISSDIKTGRVVDCSKYSYGNVYIITNSEINLRVGPSTGYESLGLLKKGTELGWMRTEGDWYYVQVTNTMQRGYISKSAIVTRSDKIQSNQECNVRYYPATSCDPPTDRIPKGTTLVVLDSQEDWYLVETPRNELAWIRSDLTNRPISLTGISGKSNFGLYFTNKVTNLNTSTGIGARPTQALPAGQMVELISDKNAGWYQVTVGNQTGYVPAEDIISISGKYVMTNNRTQLQMEPSKNSSPLATIPAGSFALLKQVIKNWCNVKIGTNNGWIEAAYLVPQKFHSLFIFRDGASGYAEARQNSSLILNHQRGDEIFFFDEKNGWYNYRFYNTNAASWINKSFVMPPKLGYGMAVERSVIYEGPNTQYSVMVERLNGGEDVPLLQFVNNWYQIMVPRRRLMGWVPAKSIKQATFKPLIVIKETKLRNRSATSGSAISNLIAGTELTEFYMINDWHYVRAPGKGSGWSYGFVNRNDVVTPSIAKYTLSSAATIYYGPGEDYAQKGTIERGAFVEIIDYDGDWKQIQRMGEVGWIKIQFR